MPATKPVTHTPGPWTVEDQVDGYRNITADGRFIGYVDAEPVVGDGLANARLIAAAPAMLAALRATEARLSACANAFYGTGTRKALQAAFEGWNSDAFDARAALAEGSAS